MNGKTIGLVILVVLLLAAGAAVAWLGTRESSEPTVAEVPVVQPDLAGPVVSISLPHSEPALPDGPHREQFHIACTSCHSTRLVLTQPNLTAAQWTASVQKMVKVYGAPLGPEQEKNIVEYLVAIKGADSPLPQ